MFSGIIQKTQKASKILKENGGLKVEFKLTGGFGVKAGESVAVDEICSTVENRNQSQFSFYYMPETLRKTTAVPAESAPLLFSLPRPLEHTSQRRLGETILNLQKGWVRTKF